MVVDVDGVVEGGCDELNVVGDDQDQGPGRSQFPQQVGDPMHVLGVQPGGGLVQAEQPCLLHAGQSDPQPLFLPSGQGQGVVVPQPG